MEEKKDSLEKRQQDAQERFIDIKIKIDNCVDDFCNTQGIQDLKQETQQTYTAMLQYIGFRLFKTKELLKDNIISCEYNSYLLDLICDYYIYLCNIYNKAVSMYGYAYIVNIPYNTLLSWLNSNSNSYNNNINNKQYNDSNIYILKELSYIKFALVKKLQQNRENSLVDKLTSAKTNPIGIITQLNHYNQWAAAGISEQATTRSAERLEREQLQALPGASKPPILADQIEQT